MRILFFLLFPIFLSAQINRAYGVIELGPTFPASSATGPKFAYRPADSSFYRWIHTNVWVKIVEPSITPDTLYLTQISGTTAIVNGDTINLTPYVLKTDTTSILAPYIKLAGWGLLKSTNTLTVDSTLLATKTFTNRFLLKSDTASMLANYPSTAGYGIIKSSKTIRADTTSPDGLATRLFAKTLPTIIATGYVATSNGTNLVARNLFDDNVAVSILNSKPLVFPTWTTAGRPASTNNYRGRNATTGFDEAYFTSQWENYITSTGASANQVPYYLSAGKIAGDVGMTWDNTNKGLSIISAATAQGRGIIVRQTNSGIQAAAIQFEKIRGSSAVQNGDIIGAFTLRGWSGSQYVTDNALFGGLVTGTVTSSSVPTSIFFNAGSTTGNYNTQLLLHSGGNVGVGNFGSILSGVFAPSEKLHVKGGIFADDGNIYISSSVNTDRNIYVNNSSNNTNSVAVLTAWAGGGSTSSTERYLTLRAFAPNYTNSAYGGSFIAGNYLIGALNFGASASAINQRLHIALGTVSSTTDTVETVYNRFSGANSISNTTRFAAISNRGFQIPGTTTADRVLSKTNQYWISYNTDSTAFNYRDNTGWHLFSTRAYARSMKDGNGIISALPLGNVTIVKTSTPSYLNLKNAGIRLKDSNAKTTHTLLAGAGFGFYAAHKTGGAGNLGGAYSFIDTLGKDFEFYMVQDDASVQQNAGTGPQIVNYLVHPSLPVTGSAWSYGVRIDTTVSIPTVRHMYGNRNADVTIPGTHKFLAGLRGNETLSGFDFRSFGTDGKIAFNVNSALNIRQGGKVYFGSDSTFSFDPSTDILQLSEYDNSASFTPNAVGEEATELFLTTSATTGKVLQRGMRQTTNVKDADLAVTDDMLELSFDIHVWAYCSNAASDSVVIDLPTPALDYVSQKVSVYGDGRNATPGRDVYVRCVGAKLWHGNASPTGETYYQVTSLGGINSKTAEFVCVQNPDDSLYYWQLIQHQ